MLEGEILSWSLKLTQLFLPLSAEQSLFDYMESILKRRLTCGEAMYYWLQILAAVDYLHNLEVPIIHKDIKGKNAETTIE